MPRNEIALSVPAQGKPIDTKRALELFYACGDQAAETFIRKHPELTPNERGVVFFLRQSFTGSEITIRKSYAPYTCRMLKWLFDQGIGDFAGAAPEHITNYAADLKKTLKPSSVNTHMAVVKAFYSMMVDVGMLTGNPAKLFRNRLTKEVGVARKKADGRLTGHVKKTLGIKQIDTFFEDLRKVAPLRDYCLIMFLYYTGARAIEVARPLLWEQIFQNEHGWFALLEGKGDKQRMVYLPDVLMVALMEMRRLNFLVPAFTSAPGIAIYPVFSTLRGGDDKFLGYNGIYRVVRKWGEDLGLQLGYDQKNISPHWMRHSNATHLLDKGVSMERIQDELGHGSITVTQRYAKVNTLKHAAGKEFDRS